MDLAFFLDLLMYKINTAYFDVIDREDQAYVLAWFWSRGSGHIQVGERDVDILYIIQKLLRYTGEVHVYNSTAELNITNDEFRAGLLRAGCVLNCHYPQSFPIISDRLARHWIRGIFDSYGTVILAKDRYVNVSIVYDENVISRIRHILASMDIDTKHYYRYSHTSTVQMLITKSRKAKKFLNWLYDDANYYLTRKFQKYHEYTKKSV